jgi:protein-disulfide isomerase
MKTIIFLLSLIAFMACNTRRQPIKTNFDGKPLPAFKLLLTDTTFMNTGNISAGKPAVLFYFNPNCPYCRAQMEDIVKNISSLKDIRFYIFTTWPFPAMRAFYNHYQLGKYPNISVGVDYTNFFIYNFKPKGTPYLAIYGKSKKLNEAFLGKINIDQLKEVAND